LQLCLVGTNNNWTNSAPTCVRITCPPDQSAPSNGEELCTDGNFLTSVCRWRSQYVWNKVWKVFFCCFLLDEQCDLRYN